MEVIGGVYSSNLFWLTAVAFGIYVYLRYFVFNVWGRLKVPHETPRILLGQVPFKYFFGKSTHGLIVKENYDKFKQNPFHGIYILWRPILVITDPELIQIVLVKNFNNFYNRGTLNNELKDPLSTGLVRLYDEKWKRLRTKLSPTFTSGKLKLMYPLIEEVSDELLKAYEKVLKETDVIEIKGITTRFTIDCIFSIAFGFNSNTLANTDSDFYSYGKLSNHIGRTFLLLSFFIPEMTKYYPLPKKRKQVEQFFINLFESMVMHRRKEKIVRNDFLNLLMQLMDQGKVDEDDDLETKTNDNSSNKITDADKITMAEAIGQAAFFFGAGQETTSTVISCCLFELAYEQEIQEKLYEEILEVVHSPGGLTYEKLFAMKYLDMVYNETLRKHPGAPLLNRICVEDFDVPNSHLRIPKGMRLLIPIKGLHMDSDIYPDPDKFDPERFSPENKAKRHPFTFIPFGEGPRICIGKRLGILKPKIALFYLLLNYKFTVCNKTPKKVKYETDYFVQVPISEMYLKVEKRKNLQN